MVCVYLLILAVVHHFTYWRESQARAQKVSEVLYQMSRTEQSLRLKGTFVNTDTRLNAIQTLAWPLVVQIRESLHLENPRLALQELDLLFVRSLHIFVARKGRIIFQNSNGLDSLLGKDWARQFFIGWHQGGDVFKTKANFLYSYPVTYDEFLSLKGRFTSYNLRGEYFLQYANSTEDYNWILLWDLQTIEDEDLETISRLSFGLTYPDLDFSNEIKFKKPVLGFMSFLGSLGILHSVFFVLVLFLLYHGGFFLLNTRFEFRLLMLMSLFYGFVLLGSYVYIEIGTEARLHVLRQRAMVHMQTITRQLEMEYAEFPGLIAKELNELFFKGQLQQLERIPGDFIMAFARLNQDGIRLVPPPNQDLFQHIVADSLPNLMLHANPELQPVKDIIQRRYPNPMGNTILAIPAEEVNRWTIFKNREYFQKVTKFAILKDGVFGYHNYQGEKDSFEVVLGIAPGKSLQREFLKRWQITNPESALPLYFTAMSLHEDTIWYNYGHATMIQRDFASLYIQLAGRLNELIAVNHKGIEGYAMLIPSQVIDGVYYFYFEDQKVVLAEENLYRKQVLGYWFLFVLFSSLLLYWLIGVFLKPVRTLETGIRRLRDGSFDIELPIPDGDELSQVCSEFNQLAQEMQHRERMLPFVSQGLLDVLKDAALKPEGLSGQAVVMFSDIRSFTTLCENNAPEEVVLMLNEYFEIWQQAVNRYGGLVDRFVGDAIRVVLREGSVSYPALHSLAIATEVLRRLDILNSQREKQGKFTIQIGIGISMGLIHFHVIKGTNKFEFFLAGDSVSEAEKLESLSKYARYIPILLSDSVYESIHGQFELLPFEHESLNSKRQWWQVVQL